MKTHKSLNFVWAKQCPLYAMQTKPVADLLYIKAADKIEQSIRSGLLKIGDKLPSVRVCAKENSISMSTVLQAYYYLEGKGLIISRPQSGYYVCYQPVKSPQKVAKSAPSLEIVTKDVETIIAEVYSHF